MFDLCDLVALCRPVGDARVKMEGGLIVDFVYWVNLLFPTAVSHFSPA